MKNKLFPLILLFTIFPVCLYSQSFEKMVGLSLDTLSIALKKKDIELAKKSFAPGFSISTSSAASAYDLLDIILKNRNFESIEFVSENKRIEKDSTILADAKIVMQDKQVYQSIIAFDRNARIIFIDYFDRLFGHSRYKKSQLVATLPFLQDEGSVILQIRLNDKSRRLSFLLDTGADGMAIRKNLADSLNLDISHAQTANVVGGQKQVEISSGNTVFLTDSVSLTNQNIAIFENVRDNIDGIIGLNLVKQYITQIDFDKKLIYLYSFGDFGYADGGSVVEVGTQYGLISIPGILNLTGKKEIAGTFVIDTGASYHLIAFSHFVRKNRLLLSGFKPESSGSTISLGHATPVYNGKASEFVIGNGIMQADMPVTLQASTGKGQDDRKIPDGSVGIQFLNRYNLTIDLLKKEIYLIPRKIL